jgi:hypothetical protein
MNYKATNPDRVAEKILECRYFLSLMAEHELAMNIEKFMYCVSAYLSSFRTIIYRLAGVTNTCKGKAAQDKLWAQLESREDVWFLKDATDLEVHGDGPKIWQHYTVNVSNSVARGKSGTRLTSRRFVGRFRGGRFSSGNEVHQSRGSTKHWQFEGHPKNLFELCRTSLDEMEALFRKEHPTVTLKSWRRDSGINALGCNGEETPMCQGRTTAW